MFTIVYLYSIGYLLGNDVFNGLIIPVSQPSAPEFDTAFVTAVINEICIISVFVVVY